MLSEGTLWLIRDLSSPVGFWLKLSWVPLVLLAAEVARRRYRRADHLWVFLFASVFWTVVELLLALRAVRSGDIVSPEVLGTQIPLWVAALLRGLPEGGAYTLIGMFVGDLVIDGQHRKDSALKWLTVAMVACYFLATFVSAHPEKNVLGEVHSRRDIFRPLALVLLATATLYSAWWFRFRADLAQARRVRNTFFALVVIGVVWNYQAFLLNGRWAEVGTIDKLARAPWYWEHFALLFDAFIEIAAMYTAFLVAALHSGKARGDPWALSP